jgi:hypothetical protein
VRIADYFNAASKLESTFIGNYCYHFSPTPSEWLVQTEGRKVLQTADASYIEKTVRYQSFNSNT